MDSGQHHSFDPWEKLGVCQGAPFTDLKKARNKKIKCLHPDKRKQTTSQLSTEELTIETNQVNDSFRMLSSEVTRRFFSREYYCEIESCGGNWGDCWKAATVASTEHDNREEERCRQEEMKKQEGKTSEPMNMRTVRKEKNRFQNQDVPHYQKDEEPTTKSRADYDAHRRYEQQEQERKQRIREKEINADIEAEMRKQEQRNYNERLRKACPDPFPDLWGNKEYTSASSRTAQFPSHSEKPHECPKTKLLREQIRKLTQNLDQFSKVQNQMEAEIAVKSQQAQWYRNSEAQCLLEVQDLQKKLQASKNKITSHAVAYEALKQQKLMLEKTLRNEIHFWKSTAQDRQTQADEATAKCNLHTQELEILKTKFVAEKTVLENGMKDLLQQLKDSQTAHVQCKAKMQSRIDISNAEMESRSTQQKLDYDARTASLEDQVSKLEKETAEAQNQILLERQRIMDLEDMMRKQKYEDELATTEREQIQIQQQQIIINDKTREINEVARTLDLLQIKHDNLQEHLMREKEESLLVVNGLRQQLEELQAEALRRVNQVRMYERLTTDLNKESEEQRRKRETVEQERDELDYANDMLKEQLEREIGEKQILEYEWRMEVEELQAASSSAIENKRMEHANKYDDLLRQLDKLHTENDSLKTDKDLLQMEKEQLEKDAMKAQAELKQQRLARSSVELPDPDDPDIEFVNDDVSPCVSLSIPLTQTASGSSSTNKLKCAKPSMSQVKTRTQPSRKNTTLRSSTIHKPTSVVKVKKVIVKKTKKKKEYKPSNQPVMTRRKRPSNRDYDGVHERAPHLVGYTCTCTSTFTRKSNLTAHINSFIDEFPCPVCGKLFGRRDSMKRHATDIHKIIVM